MTKLRSWFAGWRRRRSRSPLVLPSDLNQAISNQLSRTAGQDFFFIQVGAYDGLTNDPVYDYVLQYRWKGILIEPQVSAFEKLGVHIVVNSPPAHGLRYLFRKYFKKVLTVFFCSL